MCKRLAGLLMSRNKFSIKSRLGSFKFAFRGLVILIKNEHNARIHLFAAFVAITAGIFLRINTLEWAFIIIVIGLVFLTELINSSLESLSDLVKPEPNESIRNAKDYAAAAVLISAIISLAAGALIFIPRILNLLK
jgi:diacylglycerol kinase (ATP)